MINLKNLADMHNYTTDESATVVLYLADIKEQLTSTKSVYSRLYFRDTKSTISVPLWDVSLEAAKAAYKIDTVYSLCVTIGMYRDTMTIKRIASATEVTDPEIVKKFKPHMQKQATNLCSNVVAAAVESLKNTQYYKYVSAVYGDDKQSSEFATFSKAYASINYHDNYPGGLMNHVGGMLALAARIKENYLAGRCEKKWEVDWQYVTVGILLHDIGKLETYSAVTDHTIRYKDTCLLDHNRIGVGMLYAIHSMLLPQERLPDDTFQQLAYTICYHDDIEKLYTHKRVEDKIISYIDGLDATLACACTLE